MPFRARCNPTNLALRRNAVVALRVARPAGRSSAVSCLPVVGIRYNARRRNSTSSVFSPLSSFFSRVRGGSPSSSATTDQAAQDIVSVLSSGHLKLKPFRSAYDIVLSSSTPAQCLSPDQLLECMNLLVNSQQGGALAMLKRIYGDIPNRFGYAIGDDHKRLMVQGLGNGGSVREALDLAQTLDPTAVSWRSLLGSAITHDPSTINEIVSLLRQTHLTLDDHTLILRGLRYAQPFTARASMQVTLDEVLRDIESAGVALDLPGQAELMRLHLALRNLDQASAIVKAWDASALSTPDLWKAVIELDIARADVDQLEETIRRMRDAGYEPPQKAIGHLAAGSLAKSIASRSTVGFADIVSAVEFAEQASGTTAESHAWADVLRLFLSEVKRHDAFDIAMQVYHETLSRGLEPCGELARNLIIPLCNARKQNRVNDAIRVYDDFTSSPFWTDGHITRREMNSFATVYQYLLVACARSVPPAVGTAIRLLSDMRTHSIEITSTNLVSLLILLMKCSDDHSSAFNIYAHFYALDPSAIDEQGYKAILTSYLNLSWKRSPFPPPAMFVDMMKDMHRAGYQPGSHILASLLKQYGLTATRLRRKARSPSPSSPSTALSVSTRTDEVDDRYFIEEQLDALGQSIRDIHTLIKLDPLISPDVPLLAALMDAYARAGAFSECFEVWDELVQRRSREAASTMRQSYAAGINVILDACGWSYSLQRGRKAWGWAKRWGLVWERKQYEGWIECLCRNGEIAEAGRVVLDEMAQKGVPSADVECARIVLKFGRREVDLGKNYQAVEEFVSRLQAEKKEWYDQLKREGEIREYVGM